MLLGLIELDHTEAINGITVSFYKPTQVMVQIGLDQSDTLLLAVYAIIVLIFELPSGIVANTAGS